VHYFRREEISSQVMHLEVYNKSKFKKFEASMIAVSINSIRLLANN